MVVGTEEDSSRADMDIHNNNNNINKEEEDTVGIHQCKEEATQVVVVGMGIKVAEVGWLPSAEDREQAWVWLVQALWVWARV